jgi:hypothetical protein
LKGMIGWLATAQAMLAVAQLFSGRYERRRQREGVSTEVAPDRLPAGHSTRGEVDPAASG